MSDETVDRGHVLTFNQVNFELSQQWHHANRGFSIGEFLTRTKSFPSETEGREPEGRPVMYVLLTEPFWVKPDKKGQYLS